MFGIFLILKITLLSLYSTSDNKHIIPRSVRKGRMQSKKNGLDLITSSTTSVKPLVFCGILKDY